MSINSQVVQQNNLNKCPHGFPSGTCPICSGHGGASKDKNKPRVKGEMSYNECMAVWIRMQNAKKEKLENKIQTRLENIEKNNLKRHVQNLIIQKNALNRYMDKLSEIHKKLDEVKSDNIIKKVTINLIKVTINITNVVLNVLNSIYISALKLTSFIISVSEKLSSLLGEIKNFINSKVIEKTKKFFKTILSFFCETDSQDDDENKQRVNFKNIKEIVKKMFEGDSE